jgi:hypothetical protein
MFIFAVAISYINTQDGEQVTLIDADYENIMNVILIEKGN